MRFLILLVSFFTVSALAYVPTVESLFRNGSNPDVTVNGVSLTISVKKIQAGAKATSNQEGSLLLETKAEDFYKIFFTRLGQDVMKVAQTRYSNNTFNESSLEDKQYYPNFTAYTIKGTPEESEKGIFHGLLRSLIFNDGEYMINYLKSQGISVKLNSEILNRQKVEHLASYKHYLLAINKDRTARKSLPNPLRPEDPAARDKVEQVMNEPMYIDQKQVQIFRDNGELSWMINVGSFEAIVSYKKRQIQKIKFKSQLGELEIICKDYWLANGTHSMPRYIMVKDYKAETYQIEVLNLRHYLEKEADLINRLKKWDSILKGKESLDPKPPFIL